MAQYAGDIELSEEAGAAIRWARRMLEPGAAVILDTETTDLDGVVIEIAVIDACTGATLLDTLVDPAGEPISPGAYAAHGISAAELEGAQPWAEVLPTLRKVTKDRQILAYNADFDLGVIRRTTARAGLRLRHLDTPANWGCIMDRRSDWAGTRRRLPLRGGHRALADCRHALDVLRGMAGP